MTAMAPSKSCFEFASLAAALMAILSLTTTCGVLATDQSGCTEEYEGSPAPGLRINHAQVLGSHNSYHLATHFYQYSHPALDKQLDLGIRALELDLWYDFVSKEVKVLHVAGADEKSNCQTLKDCLTLVRSWSHSNPWHFPLFIQLEMEGGLENSTASANVCSTVDVDPATTCAVDNCVGVPFSDMEDCLTSKCLTAVLAAYSNNAACASVLDCVKSQQTSRNPNELLTQSAILDIIGACVSIPPGALSPVDLNSSVAAEVTEKLIAVIDSTFDASKRIAPSNLFKDSTEASAMQQYHQKNFWPEVDSSRGQVIFWLRHARWADSVADSSRRPFFLDGVDMAIRAANDPADVADAATNGAMVRTRADQDMEMRQSRRQAALNSGAFVVSTDLFPTVDHTQWPSQNESKHVWMPGGSPVRCHPLTVGTGTSCSSLLLENPSALKCRSWEFDETDVARSEHRLPLIALILGIFLTFKVSSSDVLHVQ
mmetsp:Transcript_86133/g.152165  ORF Transcript_86133/g.152165 Transcript_86133/m.152165 type:complete len:485 (+) Transcript_86133:46-1500(+)